MSRTKRVGELAQIIEPCAGDYRNRRHQQATKVHLPLFEFLASPLHFWRFEELPRLPGQSAPPRTIQRHASTSEALGPMKTSGCAVAHHRPRSPAVLQTVWLQPNPPDFSIFQNEFRISLPVPANSPLGVAKQLPYQAHPPAATFPAVARWFRHGARARQKCHDAEVTKANFASEPKRHSHSHFRSCKVLTSYRVSAGRDLQVVALATAVPHPSRDIMPFCIRATEPSYM
jgi:hypothetical protein